MRHSIFGQVQEGLQVLTRINELHVDENHRPLLNVRIKHTIVLDDPFDDPVKYNFRFKCVGWYSHHGPHRLPKEAPVD